LPSHVYYTSSLWLNPTTLGCKNYRKNKKAGFQWAYNIFLGQDLVFDIDEDDLNKAKREAIKLINFLKSKGYKDLKIVYSGNRGFHVYVYDWKPCINEPNPKRREEEYFNAKIDLINEINNNDIANIDTYTTLDTRRIIRLPNTVHCKSYNICQFVDNVKKFKPETILSSEVNPMMRESIRPTAKAVVHEHLVLGNMAGYNIKI
jgi:DNA primase catalytic subunit